jgi:2-oxo-4-hydroxy-4-carboxy--5-ureidoimidazoline (OHCU) decarboxylase
VRTRDWVCAGARAPTSPRRRRRNSGAPRLDALNTAYAEKFSMPFILAVRGHTPKSIIAACEQRLGQDREQERRTALGEIGRIAGYRLADLVSEI